MNSVDREEEKEQTAPTTGDEYIQRPQPWILRPPLELKIIKTEGKTDEKGQNSKPEIPQSKEEVTGSEGVSQSPTKQGSDQERRKAKGLGQGSKEGSQRPLEEAHNIT